MKRVAKNEVKLKMAEWLKTHEPQRLPADPALSKRTGYELAGAFSSSGIASATVNYDIWQRRKRTYETPSVRGFDKQLEIVKKTKERNKNRHRKWSGLDITERQANFMLANKIPIPEGCTKAQAFHYIAQYTRLEKENEKRIRLAMERDGE